MFTQTRADDVVAPGAQSGYCYALMIGCHWLALHCQLDPRQASWAVIELLAVDVFASSQLNLTKPWPCKYEIRAEFRKKRNHDLIVGAFRFFVTHSALEPTLPSLTWTLKKIDINTENRKRIGIVVVQPAQASSKDKTRTTFHFLHKFMDQCIQSEPDYDVALYYYPAQVPSSGFTSPSSLTYPSLTPLTNEDYDHEEQYWDQDQYSYQFPCHYPGQYQYQYQYPLGLSEEYG